MLIYYKRCFCEIQEEISAERKKNEQTVKSSESPKKNYPNEAKRAMMIYVKLCVFVSINGERGRPMKQFWRNLVLAGMLAALLALSGCSMPELNLNPEELYSLPTLPDKYTELNTQLNAILEDGAEYAAPASGANIQPVQLVDLDGDGREEAVAFFRNSGDEKPLKIYIFTVEEDSYRQTELIEGTGTGFYSIAYEDMDHDGRMELAVGWKATVEHQILEVYKLHPAGAEALIRTDYVKYTTSDLNQDEKKELVVIRTDEDGEGVADYYTWQEDGSLTNQSSARISVTMAELSQQGRVTRGVLQEEIPALFVTGVTDMSRAITDILAVRNGELTNIVLSEVTGVSTELAPYRSLYPTDINGDGYTEVSKAVQMDSLMDDGTFYERTDWYQYDDEGKSAVTLRTYHNLEDGWYLRLPEDWLGRIWVSRSVITDETTVTFYILKEIREEPEPFLRITAITGSSRENRAVRGTRFLLSRQDETIYTAELLDANETWKYGVTADEVREAFSLITAEWSAGDY